MNIFTFDIETVPDVEGGRRLLGLDDLTDQEVADAMFLLRRQASGTDFLRLHLQRIVAISVVLRTRDDYLKVWSLGSPTANERELIERFYDGIDKFTPTLVSWNGGGFDLPVLHYRSLVHGVAAPRYWETGSDDGSFRWNNYISRYHERHTDLMDVLSLYQARAAAPLDEMAVLCGLPGKMGMSGGKVWDAFQKGDIVSIRNYCETDVLNTYLLYLRYQRMRGQLNQSDFNRENLRVAETLQADGQAHFLEFLAQWRGLEALRADVRV